LNKTCKLLFIYFFKKNQLKLKKLNNEKEI
jgi:hypothetical protein